MATCVQCGGQFVDRRRVTCSKVCAYRLRAAKISAQACHQVRERVMPAAVAAEIVARPTPRQVQAYEGASVSDRRQFADWIRDALEGRRF